MSESTHNDPPRDAALTAIYRAAPADVPPATLDAAILAAARREVRARPREAGFSFRSLRVPMSIAAVLALSVSLVTLMREEAPELTEPPRADSSPVDSKLSTGGNPDEKAERSSVGVERQPKNVGLKPPQSNSSSLGIRGSDFSEPMRQRAKKEQVLKSEAEVAPSGTKAKRRDVARDNDQARDKNAVVSAGRPDSRAEADSRRVPAPPSEATFLAKKLTSPAPVVAAPPAGAVAGGLAANIVREPLADRVEPAPRSRAQANDAPARQLAEASPAFAPNPPQAVTAVPAPPQLSPPPPAVPAPQLKPAFRAESVDKAEPRRAPAVEAKPPALALQDKTAPAKDAAAATAPDLRSTMPGKLEQSIDLIPEKWLERIVELRRAGRLDEAKASLAEFRKRYPDYRLPDALRDLANP